MSKVALAAVEYLLSNNLNKLIDSIVFSGISVNDIIILEKYGYDIIIQIIQNIDLEEDVIDYLTDLYNFHLFVDSLVQYQTLNSHTLIKLLDNSITPSYTEWIYTKQKLSESVIDFCINRQLALDALLLHQNLTEEQIKSLLERLDENMEDFRVEWILKSLPENYYASLLTHKYQLVRNIIKSLLES